MVRLLPFGLAVNAGESETAAAGGTVSHRKGFTLIEMLIVIMIIGILVLIGYPKVSRAMATTNVRGARTTIVNMIAKARAVATQSNRQSAQLEFVGNSVLVTAQPRASLVNGTKDTVAGVQNLNTIYGVTVNTGGIAAVVFDPRGIGTGFNSTGSDILISKSGKTQTIHIDMLGRVK
jgi:prepilin-type N-terminal cleavage/methylation domain-containing protein